MKQYDEAAKLYSLGEKLDAANPLWARGLARVYTASDDKQKLTETLLRITKADIDDLADRKKLAQLALERKDYAAAEQAALEGLEIDVQDAELHVALAESFGGRHNNEKAIEEWEIAVEVAPDKPQMRYGLANAYNEAGDKKKAKETIEKLLKISPGFSKAKELLKQLESEK
jgi:tetratricopeptide (TPR) repeat protein